MSTIRLGTNEYLITSDARGRALIPDDLTHGHRRFSASEVDGVIRLTPVRVTVTRVLSDPRED